MYHIRPQCRDGDEYDSYLIKDKDRRQCVLEQIRFVDGKNTQFTRKGVDKKGNISPGEESTLLGVLEATNRFFEICQERFVCLGHVTSRAAPRFLVTVLRISSLMS